MSDFRIDLNLVTADANRFEGIKGAISTAESAVDSISQNTASIGIGDVNPSLEALKRELSKSGASVESLRSTLELIIKKYKLAEFDIASSGMSILDWLKEGLHALADAFANGTEADGAQQLSDQTDLGDLQYDPDKVKELMQKDIDDLTDEEWKYLLNALAQLQPEDLNDFVMGSLEERHDGPESYVSGTNTALAALMLYRNEMARQIVEGEISEEAYEEEILKIEVLKQALLDEYSVEIFDENRFLFQRNPECDKVYDGDPDSWVQFIGDKDPDNPNHTNLQRLEVQYRGEGAQALIANEIRDYYETQRENQRWGAIADRVLMAAGGTIVGKFGGLIGTEALDNICLAVDIYDAVTSGYEPRERDMNKLADAFDLEVLEVDSYNEPMTSGFDRSTSYYVGPDTKDYISDFNDLVTVCEDRYVTADKALDLRGDAREEFIRIAEQNPYITIEEVNGKTYITDFKDITYVDIIDHPELVYDYYEMVTLLDN